MIRHRIFSSWHGVLLLLAAMLLVISLAVALSAISRMGRAVAWVNHSFLVIVEVNRCVALIRFAETEQNAYELTGKAEYLANFRESAGELRAATDLVSTLLANNPAQAERFVGMRKLIDARLAELHQAAQVRPTPRLEEMRSSIEQEANLSLLLEIRERAEAITSRESHVLERRYASMSQRLEAAVWTSSVTGLLALVLTVYTFWMMHRAARALEREAGLRQAKDDAEQADRAKSEFLANVSHEIRTPMNAVLGFAELLRGTATTPKQHQYVEAINSSGRALLTLINDILDLSTIEAGRFEIVRQPTSVRSVLGSVRSIFSQEAGERGLELRMHVDDSVPAALEFDATRLRQILFNLVGNALKFTPQGSVVVRARAEFAPGNETATTLFLSVTDTGIGIAPEHQQVIFEPFRQAGAGLDRVYNGSGLGLSITRRLVRMLGGEIELKSDRDRGTVIALIFPHVALSSSLPEEERLVAAGEDLNVLRPSLVLVADDVALNRELIACYIEGTHHRLIHASSAREAVEKAREYQPDVVLLDAGITGGGGRAARALIQREPGCAALPIIAITGSAREEEVNRLRREFAGVVGKPFSRAALCRELARILPAAHAEVAESEPLLVPSVIEGADDEPGDPQAWGAMLERLHEMERKVWPQLVQTMGVCETTAFAHELNMLAEQAGCPSLLRYARQLADQAESFQTTALEASLRSFGVVVERLSATMGQSS